tara:strand:+ start:2193 stop:4373 length:2181 start_codon:yes stop_codon:yes gene_type:complete
MKSSILSSISYGVAGGGTISGDVTITGDLSVEGGGSFTFDEMLAGNMSIDKSNHSSGWGLNISGRNPINGIKITHGAIASAHGLTIACIESGGVTTAKFGDKDGGVKLSLITNGTGEGNVEIGALGDGGALKVFNASANHEAQFLLGGLAGVYKVVADNADNSAKLGSINGALSLAAGGSFTTRMVIDSNSKISLSNNDSGTSNTVFGSSQGTIDSNSDENVFIGHSVAGQDNLSQAEYNVVIGSNAGNYLSQGDHNVVVGRYAGSVLTTGSGNVMIGSKAGEASGASAYHVLIGYKAGEAINNATANGTVAIGYESGKVLTSGAGNTLVGYNSGVALTGDKNSIFGYKSGYGLTSGDENTHVGWEAGYYNATSSRNTSVGSRALSGASGVNKEENTSVGFSALKVCAESYNTGIGANAGLALSTGGGNTLLGSDAGIAITASSNNVIIGRSAAPGSGTTTDSTIIGKGAGCAGSSNNFYNVFIGQGSGSGTWAGSCEQNVAIGNGTLKGNMNGANYNTALGYEAGKSVTTGDVNTLVGFQAGDTLTTGSGNVYIGAQADPSAVDITDEIVLKAGTDALAGGGTETIRIGVDSDYIVNDFGENATWTHSSDRRIKKNIVDNDLGLEFVNKLKTRKFQKKAPSEYPQEFEQYNAETTERKNPDKIHYGFVAQEVKEAMDEVGHSEFPMWQEQKDGMQLLGEAELITPLIKAVQELSAKVEELESKLK